MEMTKQARRPTLRRLADEKDMSVAAMIDTAVREHGSVDAAAKALGVNPMSVYRWLKRNNVRVERQTRLVRAS